MQPHLLPHRVGSLARYQDFPSQHITPRTIEVWVPDAYLAHPEQRFSVLYMHDGQNLWYPNPTMSNGYAWDVDLACAALGQQGAIPPPLIVAIANHPQWRFMEYMPQAPTESPAGEAAMARFRAKRLPDTEQVNVYSDSYVQFIVSELKPFIDAHYRTRREPASTLVMGSSMGGLISLYTLIRHPDVFGGAGCLSTHWVAAEGIVVDWLPGHLPEPSTHRIYFDYGTEGIDAPYEPYQQRVDALMAAAGYQQRQNWETRKFPGADHREDAWAARLPIPLTFLLG